MRWRISYYIPFYFFIYPTVVFFLTFPASCYHFLCVWSASFSHSLKVGRSAKNSLSFPSPKNVLISPSFIKDHFVRYRIKHWQFFLLAFEKCTATFWPPWFQIRNCHSSWCTFVGNMSLSKVLGVDFSGFIVFGICSDSWVCRYMSLIWGYFQPLFLQILFFF